MANVVVSVADRPYTMQCPDGEEDHLRELASLLDAEIVRIKQSVGSIGDIRLLVMSGLMVADRLSEAIRKIESLEDQIKGYAQSHATRRRPRRRTWKQIRRAARKRLGPAGEHCEGDEVGMSGGTDRSILPPNGSVLGIDVGYSEIARSSAVCRFDWNANRVTFVVDRFRAVEPERSDALCKFADRNILSAALDGPLRSDLKVIGRYRWAESLLTRKLQPFIGKPGQSSSPNGRKLNAAANECARILLSTGTINRATHRHAIHEIAVVEAFPTSFLGLLLDDPAAIKAKRPPKISHFF